jgi:hypothetical protein
MGFSRRNFTKQFKLAAVRRPNNCGSRRRGETHSTLQSTSTIEQGGPSLRTTRRL